VTGEDPEQVPNSYKQALRGLEGQVAEHVWQSEAATDLTSAIGAEPDEVAPGDRRARWYAWRHHVPEAF
jgi:hypothetical protein